LDSDKVYDLERVFGFKEVILIYIANSRFSNTGFVYTVEFSIEGFPV